MVRTSDQNASRTPPLKVFVPGTFKWAKAVGMDGWMDGWKL